MKKIGMIGGMSWESSTIYYQLLNEKTKQLLGGFHSCRCVMDSVDFADIEKLQHENNWKELNRMMVETAQNLERAGAELILLCTNTMHLCSAEIIKNTSIPFLHIATATGRKVKADNINKVLLLGTKFTMEKDFYRNILQNDFGIEVVIPNEEDRDKIHRTIYEELVLGVINPESRKTFQEIINRSKEKGVEGVVLGCTEIPLLIGPNDVTLPIYNTTKIHAESAVEFAIQD